MIRKKSKKSSKVIHVDFGRRARVGGEEIPGREHDANHERRASLSSHGRHDAPLLAREASQSLAVSEVFTATEAARLAGLSIGQLRGLGRAGIAAPSAHRGPRRGYTFGDLILLRTVKGLLARKVKRADIAVAVGTLRASLGESRTPTAEMRIVSDGKRVALRSRQGTYQAGTGQFLLDFDVSTLRDDVVAVLESTERRDRQRRAYELYVRASQLDEDPATIDEAESLYRLATELDPWLAIAFTNLGNIRFRRGEEDAAMELYERALSIDPRQPEAQYNTGYVLLDRGNPLAALPHFEGAVAADGRFADAHFYLAMAYESVGSLDEARLAWTHYLELEPVGTWADIARRHL